MWWSSSHSVAEFLHRIRKHLVYLGRYAHQPLSEVIHLPITEFYHLTHAVAELLEDETEAVRRATDG